MDDITSKKNKSKIASTLEILKNVKFIVINVAVLIILGIAFISGDGTKILSEFYVKLTGQQYETFSTIDENDFSTDTYLIVKDKLLREYNISIENADITLFKESEVSHKYRIVLNEDKIYYLIRKKSDGIWRTTTIHEAAK